LVFPQDLENQSFPRPLVLPNLIIGSVPHWPIRSRNCGAEVKTEIVVYKGVKHGFWVI
jgi:hypothetical protein